MGLAWDLSAPTSAYLGQRFGKVVAGFWGSVYYVLPVDI
jgi:hypothetical protein